MEGERERKREREERRHEVDRWKGGRERE